MSAYFDISSGVPEYLISIPSNLGMPQLPFVINGMCAWLAVAPISSAVTKMSDAPTPQFAPIATGGTARSEKTSAKPSGFRPIIVRPAVSKLHVATYGMPTLIAA